MRKIKLNGKLSLNKETVTKLNNMEMSKLKGKGVSQFNCGNDQEGSAYSDCLTDCWDLRCC